MTAAGDLPTEPPPPRPSGERPAATAGDVVSGDHSGEVPGRGSGTGVTETVQGGGSKMMSSEGGGTTGETRESTVQKTTNAPGNRTAPFSASPSLTSLAPSASRRPTTTQAAKVEGRQAAAETTNRPETSSAASSTTLSVSSRDTSSLPPSTAKPASPGTTISRTAVPQAPSRGRRHTEEGWEESGKEWDDHTEEVIVHWAPAASDCLLRPDQRNLTHCFTQLEHNLQVRTERER